MRLSFSGAVNTKAGYLRSYPDRNVKKEPRYIISKTISDFNSEKYETFCVSKPWVDRVRQLALRSL